MNRNTRRITGRSAGRYLSGGFTLIELLLVLVILAALAAIVVPKIAGRGVEAKIKSTITQISMFETALELFRVDNGRYPTSEEGLKALVEQPSNCPNWNKEGYLPKGVPNDPWGNPYIYHCPGQHLTTGFDIYSFGPDLADGGGDDIDNWTQH
jgi:general secretion pathway protein G